MFNKLVVAALLAGTITPLREEMADTRVLYHAPTNYTAMTRCAAATLTASSRPDYQRYAVRYEKLSRGFVSLTPYLQKTVFLNEVEENSVISDVSDALDLYSGQALADRGRDSILQDDLGFCVAFYDLLAKEFNLPGTSLR